MQKPAGGRTTSFKKKRETGLWEDDFTLMSSFHRTTRPTFAILFQTDPFLQIRLETDPFLQISPNTHLAFDSQMNHTNQSNPQLPRFTSYIRGTKLKKLMAKTKLQIDNTNHAQMHKLNPLNKNTPSTSLHVFNITFKI